MSSPTSASAGSSSGPAPSPFSRLADFVAIPRIASLALSPGGDRLAVALQTLDREGKKWRSALWELDPEGRRPARRLTRSTPGESAPAWAPDGSLLFTSARPDPGVAAGDDPKPTLWRLPPDGGEARPVVAHPGGVDSFAVAGDSGDVVVVASAMPGGSDPATDEELRKKRADAGVSAILHEAYRCAPGTTTSGRRYRTCSGPAGCPPTKLLPAPLRWSCVT